MEGSTFCKFLNAIFAIFCNFLPWKCNTLLKMNSIFSVPALQVFQLMLIYRNYLSFFLLKNSLSLNETLKNITLSSFLSPSLSLSLLYIYIYIYIYKFISFLSYLSFSRSFSLFYLFLILSIFLSRSFSIS
jgi:hypothetical protein